jgi:hypothetical protein
VRGVGSVLEKSEGGVGARPPGFRELFRNSYLTTGAFFSGNKWMRSSWQLKRIP